MLNRKEFVQTIENKDYAEMISKVDIPNFTKCIATFADLPVREISDEVIKKYLLQWAQSKASFYTTFLNRQLKVDRPIVFTEIKNDIRNDVRELQIQYPSHAPWLDYFKDLNTNLIKSVYSLSWEGREMIERCFPNKKIDGTSLTRFFEKDLKAPEELVTAIGRIFENTSIQGTYTMSIDPVDMMLASETPYGWHSCYSISNSCNNDSHADGCLAAVLDNASLITYIWTTEGNMGLNNEKISNVRYKKFRRWIALNFDFDAIHFNTIYPSKFNTPEDFDKQLREYTETIIAEGCGFENIWKKTDFIEFQRDYVYGYGEFGDNVYINKRAYPQEDKGYSGYTTHYVYDVAIDCPCGCKDRLPGSDEENDCDECGKYQGGGFVCYNFDTMHWCGLADDWCTHGNDICEENCRGCWSYDNEHPYCELDNHTVCDNVDYESVDDGVIACDVDRCCGCPLYKLHHPDKIETEETEENKTEADVSHITFAPDTISVSTNVFPATISEATLENLRNATEEFKPFFINDNPVATMSFSADSLEPSKIYAKINEMCFTYRSEDWTPSTDDQLPQD